MPSTLLFLLFVGGIIWAAYMFASDRPLLRHSNSHWHTRIDGLNGTATDFYARVQAAIRSQNFPDVYLRIVSWHEGGLLSDKREYLRIGRGDHILDLCVASFGNGLFVSSWLCADPKNIVQFVAHLPVVGLIVRLFLRLFDPETYYKIDSAYMFQGGVHACILAVLDEMTTGQGLPPLGETERKPVLRELYALK